MQEKYGFQEYVEIIKKLRAPDGCPWDRAQTHESLKPCMIDETAEAMAAIDVWRETGDSTNLCEELGDMLLQVVLQSQIAAEEGLFDISDVLQAAGEKMVRRHPHVFAGADSVDWEGIKRAEREHVSEQVKRAKERALQKAQKDMAERVKSHVFLEKS